MAKIEKYICDIANCDNETNNIGIQMQIIFTTEQTEGRNVEPYFSIENLDLCEKCLNITLKERKYIIAHGAMGNNTYDI